MTLNERVGAAMRALRDRAGMTLEQVEARKMRGLCAARLSMLERGKAPWRIDRIEALCAVYGADWREVFNG